MTAASDPVSAETKKPDLATGLFRNDWSGRANRFQNLDPNLGKLTQPGRRQQKGPTLRSGLLVRLERAKRFELSTPTLAMLGISISGLFRAFQNALLLTVFHRFLRSSDCGAFRPVSFELVAEW